MKPQRPPGWAEQLLHRICRDDYLEEVIGDLHEAFLWRCEEKGRRYAKIRYLWEVFLCFRFYQPQFYNSSSQKLSMYKNYLKSGWRFLQKHRLQSIINILGLAIGISFCWIGYLYAQDELSYNKHLSSFDRLYRLVIAIPHENGYYRIGGASHLSAMTYESEIPAFAAVSPLKNESGLLQLGDQKVNQSFMLAGPDIEEMLDLSFVEGKAALATPDQIIISETLAGKLNLRGKAVNQLIEVYQNQKKYTFQISGVYKDIPANTSFRPEMIAPYELYVNQADEKRLSNWFDINMNVLVELSPKANLQEVEQLMNEVYHERASANDSAMHLQAMRDFHFSEEYSNLRTTGLTGDRDLLYLIMSIGLICLLISIINYANFSVSLYANRLKEMALRKVIGTSRGEIVRQLFVESSLSIVLAGLFAVVILSALLPLFSSFIGKSYTFSYVLDWPFLLGAFGILLLTSIASAVYPAYLLAKFEIRQSLRGQEKLRHNHLLSKLLIGLQFMIATSLIAGAAAMQRQVSHMADRDLGMTTENIMDLGYIRGSSGDIQRFVQEVSQLTGIEASAALSGYNGTAFKYRGEDISTRHLRVDGDALGMLDVRIISGRNFNPDLQSDLNNAVIINKTLADRLAIENPVGLNLPFEYGDLKQPKIIGVAEDFHFASIKQNVEPLVIYQAPIYDLSNVLIKIEPGQYSLASIEEVWNKHFAPFMFEYTFMDQVFEESLQTERIQLRLILIGCIVSILLSAIGLMGVLSLQLKQRLKEISIRKVLGASLAQLYQLIGKRYVGLLLISTVTGIAIASHFVNSWLEKFPYRISFGAELIIFTIVVVTAVALIAIFSQMIRLRNTNPVDHLLDM